MNEGDLVLAKIKGFPDWPAVIVPVDNIPVKLQTPKYSKFIDNYLTKSSDQVCVKFFYDDQYSWTKISNVKPLQPHVIHDHILTANESKRGGRVKRITEAYIKARDVPVDEFLEFGSFGKPEVEEEEEEEEMEDVVQEVVETKKRGRAGAVKAKSKAKTNAKTKTKTKPRAGAKNTKSSTKGKKKTVESSSEEPFDEDDEILEFMDNDDDEDFEGPDDISEEVEIEEDEEEEDDEDDDDDDDEEEHSTSKKRKIQSLVPVDSPFLSKQPADFHVNFADIPTASALADEVTEMTRWCSSLRRQLQSAILDENTKQSVIDDLISPLVSADLSKSIIKSTKLAQVVHILLSIPERQSSTTKKLAKWWSSNFDFNVNPDIHWSPTFTEEMHLEEESARRAHVAFLRQKRKEERKQSETPVPASA